MFCAITTTIERCKTEGVVDVFQVVKAMRTHKPGAVRTVVSLFNSNNNNDQKSITINDQNIVNHFVVCSI